MYKRVHLPRDRHLIDGAVARRATHAFLHVNAVIEKNEIRQLIHALPLNRLPGRHAFANRREHRRVFPHLRMTRHASLRWRNPRKGRFLNSGVTIPAIKSKSGYVMLMTERRRLRERHVHLRRVRRTIHRIHDAPEPEEREKRTGQRHSRNAVAAPAKNLAHNFAAKKDSRVQLPKRNRGKSKTLLVRLAFHRGSFG